MLGQLSESQWQTYQREGYLVLDRCLTDDEVSALQGRMNDMRKPNQSRSK